MEKNIWQSIKDDAIAYGRESLRKKLELSRKEQDTSLAPLKKTRKRKQKDLNLESDKDSQKPD
ncbi:hypothetical protein H6G91_17120 [Nostoc muscorum FACHB-395]|nr:hypothetical protein [Desmonostoc muscorum FACHB-395]